MTTEEKTAEERIEKTVEKLALKVEQQHRLLESVENRSRATEAAFERMAVSLSSTAFIAGVVERFLDWKFGPRWDRGARREAARRAEAAARCRELLNQAHRAYDLSEEEKVETARELHDLVRELGAMTSTAREVVMLYVTAGEVEAAVDYLDEMISGDEDVPPELDPLIEQLLYRCKDLAEKAGNEPLRARVEALIKPTN